MEQTGRQHIETSRLLARLFHSPGKSFLLASVGVNRGYLSLSLLSRGVPTDYFASGFLHGGEAAFAKRFNGVRHSYLAPVGRPQSQQGVAIWFSLPSL